MAGESAEGSGPMGDDWAPSPELLEERELLSGLLDGLSELAAGAPVDEIAVVPDPGAEEPPAVVAPLAEVSASAAAAQPPASVRTAHAAESHTGAREMPAAVHHSTPPGAQPVDSLLAKLAVENESHANSTLTDSTRAPAAEAHAAAEDQAQVSAHVTAARATGPAPAPEVHAVDASTFRVDGARSADGEWECLPTDEEAVQPHISADVSAGERTAETAGQDMPTLEDNQPEEVKAPIERSLARAAGDDTASDPSWVGAEHETTRAPQAGEVSIVEQAEAEPEDELVSRVSQLFDRVPNWPGVDLDALEDAAQSQIEDDTYSGAGFVDVVSTDDVSRWATAAAGTAIGFGIAQRELGQQTRDIADGPNDDEAELRR